MEKHRASEPTLLVRLVPRDEFDTYALAQAPDNEREIIYGETNRAWPFAWPQSCSCTRG